VKKILKMAAPVLVLVAGFGVVQAMIAAKPEPEKKEDTQRLISLYVDEVRSEIVTVSVDTQGEVRPKTEIELVPEVSGRIVAVADQFAEGASFGPDTTLIKIDDANYKLAVTRAQARVAEADVKLAQELASASIKRRQYEDNAKGAAPSPLQVNRPQVIQAQAGLRSAEADLAEAQLNLDRTQIKVPFVGHVREKSAGLGQYVSVGTSLGRVFSTDTVEVRLPLTDSQLMELNLPMGFVAKGGNGPQVKLLASIGNTDHVWHGRIVRTNAAVDQRTRMIYVVAEVNDPYGEAASNGMPLAVGLFVSAEIAGVTPQQAFVMPRTALRNADKVYVINDEDRLEIRTVSVLSTSEDRVLVINGVTAGERVVTSTIATAVDGMQVQAITRDEQLAQN
jgi:RND family efflux transporter MFP subunit